jgi:lipid-A-disaccharide synthase
VRGYVEVLRHYREISASARQLGRALLADRPAAFIGVDAPDFNLGLEARLRPPASRRCTSSARRSGPGAAAGEEDGRSGDHVLCLFPSSPSCCSAHGVAATYVGHPLADAIPLQPPRAASARGAGPGDGDTVVALLPGSRRSEIQYIAPRLAAGRSADGASARAAVRAAGGAGLRPLLVEPLVAAACAGVNLQLLDGQSHEALAACDVTSSPAAPPRWRRRCSSGRW